MADIRLRHLLHHTSGLADVTAPSRGVPASNADVFERLQRRRQPALDSPGRRFCYNNTGYVLLAEVVSLGLSAADRSVGLGADLPAACDDQDLVERGSAHTYDRACPSRHSRGRWTVDHRL